MQTFQQLRKSGLEYFVVIKCQLSLKIGPSRNGQIQLVKQRQGVGMRGGRPRGHPPARLQTINAPIKKKLRICKCCVVGSLLNHPVCPVFVNQRRITFVDTSDLIRYPDYGLYSLSSPWSCYCDCFRYWFLLLVLLIDEGVNIRVDLVSTLDRSFAMCRVVGPSSWN